MGWAAGADLEYVAADNTAAKARFLTTEAAPVADA